MRIQESSDSVERIEQLLEKLRQTEELNRDLMGLVENSYDGLAVMDGDTRLMVVNPALERLLGATKAELIGNTVKDRVAETGRDPGASLKVVETGKPQTVMMHTWADRQVLSTAVPFFDKDGKLFRIYCNLRDITELNQLKEKFEQSQMLVSKYLVELHEVKQQTVESQFVVHSVRMKEIMDTAYRIARVDASVLLLGESGVGKGVISKIIHDASRRANGGVFVKVNCGAIPGDLIESELFGYEGGAFTGANKDGKAGYFEIADRGTLLLDEIGDLPLRLQVKLLSVLQDYQVTRVGGTRSRKVDVRIIAATNRDLKKMVRSGEFREDLFYRLNVVPLIIPPLRERRDDIPFLLVHYIDLFNKKYDIHTRLSKETVESLCAYKWPGNVRELANLMERLVVTSNASVITPEQLPKEYILSTGEYYSVPTPIKPLREQVTNYERSLVKKAVSQSNTLEEAAHRLGISLSTLTRRLRSVKRDSHN